MSPTPETLAAFNRWKNAELASHYAAPCPDDVMDHLVFATYDAFYALQDAPTLTADDMLLKLFPVLLREMEPAAGCPPLRPGRSRCHPYADDFYVRLFSDLSSVSPALSVALAMPAVECRRPGDGA